MGNSLTLLGVGRTGGSTSSPTDDGGPFSVGFWDDSTAWDDTTNWTD